MKLRYNYKLYPNNKQKTILNNHFFTSNQAFNICLNLIQNEFKLNKILKRNNIIPSYYTDSQLDNKVKTILKHRNLSFNTKVLQQSRKNFKDSMTKFYKSLKTDNKNGMIDFKTSSSTSGSFETTAEQYKIKDYINSKGEVSKRWKVLRLFNQSFKFRYHRSLPSKPKTITILVKDGDYEVSFVVEKKLKIRKSKYSEEYNKSSNYKNSSNLKSIGLDINLDSLDLGTKRKHKAFKISFKNDNLIVKNSKKIKKLQRKQSRRIIKSKKSKTKLSKAFNKTQVKINKLYTKNSNKKTFNLHLLTNQIINYIKENKFNHLVVEDLDVKSMTSKKNINKFIGKTKSKSMKRNILQVSFGKILGQLIYKCALNEIYITKVDPVNTSRSCSRCSHIKQDLNLSDRIYNCDNCGLEIARDLNACINILKKAD